MEVVGGAVDKLLRQYRICELVVAPLVAPRLGGVGDRCMWLIGCACNDGFQDLMQYIRSWGPVKEGCLQWRKPQETSPRMQV